MPKNASNDRFLPLSTVYTYENLDFLYYLVISPTSGNEIETSALKILIILAIFHHKQNTARIINSLKTICQMWGPPGVSKIAGTLLKN